MSTAPAAGIPQDLASQSRSTPLSWSDNSATIPGPRWVKRGTAAYRRVSLALFMAGFSTFGLIYAVQPLLPSLVVEFHIHPSESSLALSLTTGFLAFAILCAGALSESVSRRGLMFASMLGAAILHIGSAVAPNWSALLILRALEGLALGGVPAVAMAYLAEEIHPKALGTAMGLYVGGTAFGAMMGRVGVGLLTEFTTWRMALGTLGAINLIAAIGFFALLPSSRNFLPQARAGLTHHRQAWLGHLNRPGLPLLFVTGFLALGINVTMFNYITFRLSGAPFNLSHGQISAIFTVFLFGTVASPMAGALADRLGRGTVLVVGIATMAGGLALTLLPSLLGVVSGVIGVTVGFFIAHSVSSGWVGRMAEAHKGHASSLYLLAYYLGSSVIGTAGGWFWTEGGWWFVAGFNAVLLTIALAIAIRLWWSERQNRAGGRRQA